MYFHAEHPGIIHIFIQFRHGKKEKKYSKLYKSNLYSIQPDILNMKALCLITVKPGKVDTVVEILKKKRKIIKNVMIVTGRADVTAVLNGNIDEINNTVIDFKKIKEIVTTETLIEVEVNMGW